MGTKVQLGALLALAGLVTGCSTASKCHPAQVAPGLYQGCLPATTQDFGVLRRQGIRTILSLETLTYHIVPERQLAQRSGMGFVNVPILPSVIRPQEERIKEALLILNNPSLRPIFVHCLVGDDRTAFIIGLYRMYFENWTPEAAWQEMLRSGFHARWWLYGLESYFWRHTRRPDWVKLKTSSSTLTGRTLR